MVGVVYGLDCLIECSVFRGHEISDFCDETSAFCSGTGTVEQIVLWGSVGTAMVKTWSACVGEFVEYGGAAKQPHAGGSC